MPRTIVYNGTSHTFPDDATDDEIRGVLEPPKTAAGFASNLLSSTGKLAGDALKGVAHPIDTLNALGAIPVGIAEKVGKAAGLPVGEGSGSTAFDGSSAKMLDGLIDHVKSRYGSLEKFKETLYNDPAGVLADFATIAGGGGAALKGVKMMAEAAGATKAAAAAGEAARIAGTVSSVIDPLQVLGKGAKIAGTPIARKLGVAQIPERLYQSALKPGPGSYSLDEARQMVQTGLRNNIPVSEAGAQRLSDLVDDLNAKIQATVDGSPKTVDTNAIAQRVDQIRPGLKQQVNPVTSLKQLDASKAEFLAEQGARPGRPATPPQPTGLLDPSGNPIMTAGAPATPPTPAAPMAAADAQAMKQNTYRQMRANYGEMKNAQIEAQKALARGIKEELVNAFPELAGLNAKESELLGLQPALERAVRRTGNHELIGIGTPIAAGAAGAAAASAPAAAAAAVLKTVLDNPMLKSKLAIALDFANRKPGVVRKYAGTVAAPAMSQYASRIQSYLDDLSSTYLQPQNGQLGTQPAR